MSVFCRTIMSVLCLLIPLAAQAGPDERLYDPVAPDGSAFVRFIHGDASSAAFTPQANGKHYDALNFKDVSAYFALPAGNVRFSADDFSVKQGLVAGQSYSVVMRAGGLNVLNDSALGTLSKALISFYNLTSKNALSLQTAGEKTVSIFNNIGAGHNAAREINAVKLGLSVAKDGAAVADLAPILLERKNAYSVIAFDGPGGVEARMVRAQTDTTR